MLFTFGLFLSAVSGVGLVVADAPVGGADSADTRPPLASEQAAPPPEHDGLDPAGVALSTSAAGGFFDIRTSRTKFRVVQGEEWEVEMTVKNTGDRAAEHTVSFEVGPVYRETSLSLQPGEERTWTTTVSSDQLSAGSYVQYFRTPDDTNTHDLDVEAGYPDLLVGNLRAEDQSGETVNRVDQGDVIDIEATIYNDGEGLGSESARCYLDSTDVGGEFMQVDVGEYNDISCTVDTSDYSVGYHEFGVETSDDGWYKDIYIDDPPQPPEITSASPSSTVVLTTGDGDWEELSVSVNDPDTGSSLLDYVWTVDGTRVGDGRFLDVYADDLSSGSHTVRVAVDDDQSETATVAHEWTVEVVVPPTIDSVNPETERIEVGPDDETTLTADVSDADTPTSQLRYRWFVDGNRADSGEQFSFDGGQYDPGQHTIELRVGDGTTQTADATYTWTAAVLRPPRIGTISPENKTLVPGVQTSFSVSVSDGQGSPVTAVEWTVDGQRITGDSFTYTFDSVGSRTVQVTARNQKGVETTETFDVRVVATPPTLTDVGPDSSSVRVGDSVGLDVTPSDPKGRDLSLDYEWRVDGRLHSDKRSPQVSFSELGTHDVELTVTNQYGASTTREFTVSVENDRPQLLRQSPTTDSYSEISQRTVRFAATVTNHDTGPVDVAFLVDGDVQRTTSVDSDEELVSFQHSFATPGASTVTVRATDSHGARNELSWDVDVRSRPPTFASTVPDTKRLHLSSGDEETFRANATDPEGEGVSYTWQLDGETIGTGPTVSHRFAESGDYTVTVTAEDPRGSTSTKSWAVGVTRFATEPQRNVHLSDVTIDPDGNQSTATFLSMSLENPQSNARTVVVEFVVENPDGLNPVRLSDVSESSQAQVTGVGVVPPGQQKSMRIGLELSDESLAGEELPFGVTIRYYPEDNPADVELIREANVVVNIADDTPPSVVSTPGFTPVSSVVALLLFALVGRRLW